jgi:A/G-specific adenine glycosylase
MTGDVLDFRAALLAWYGENARDLPWRRTRDPYVVWVSEIMLQQTRVAAVVEYFERFLKAFPTIEALAGAEEANVLAQWSGLGYYRRARMMHRAAKMVVAEQGGRMPETAAKLRELPGIGEYTAAAVASISHGEAVPVVDGNVERVLQRVYGPELAADGGKPTVREFREAAKELLDGQRPGEFNQAMMELGAMVCLPRGPLCGECPVREHCRTQGEHETGPAKQMRSQQVAYALMQRNSGWEMEVLLRQRGEDESQMPGLWELPAIEDGAAREEQTVLTVRHSITNTNYYVTVYAMDEGELQVMEGKDAALRWVKEHELGELALTGLARKVLKRVRILPGLL